MKPQNNSHEVVMITGASAGIGRATAHAFARRGAWIGILARSEECLQEACREIESLGGRGLVLVADVADDKAVEAAAERLESEFGPIDIWINNAMASVFSPIAEMEPSEFRRVSASAGIGARAIRSDRLLISCGTSVDKMDAYFAPRNNTFLTEEASEGNE